MSNHNAQLVDGIAAAAIVKGQFLKFGAGGWTPCTVLGERSDGVAFSDAPNVGDAVCVQVDGLVKYKVGAVAIVDGAIIVTDANGLGKTAVATNVARLKAVGAAAIGAFGMAQWIDAYVV
jgi:hypothetical protein